MIASDGEIAPGEIVLDGVSRSFSMRADKGRTLKELFVDRRDAAGPAPIQALQDVSLHIEPGETVGLIGRNGAGKSSTLRLLAGIIPPDRGIVRCGGRIQTLLELGSGFSRDFTGRENIYLNGALHGLSKTDIEERIERIIAFADLGDFIEAPVKTYSSGMFVRLGFAIAGHLDADVLLIDELLAVGDEAFQRKCMRRIAERIEEGATLVLVSHAAAAIERICERVLVLDGGRLVFDGPSPEGLLHYHRLLGTERPDSTPVPRLGEAPFEIAELELQDGRGNRSDVFRTGEPLRVALTLKATRPAGDPLLQLELRDLLGRRLYTSETSPALNEGAARLHFRVPRVALLGGDYEIVLSAREAGPSDAPSYDRVVGFNVVDQPGAEGVLDLKGTWSSGEPADIAERLRVVARLSTSGTDGSPAERVSSPVGGGEAEDAPLRRPAGTLAVSPEEEDAGPGAASPATEAKALVQEFYEQAINGRDASVCERLLTADFVHNGERRGAAGQQQAIQVFLDAFSPLRHEILVVFAEGDLVCARQRWSGTHVGEFFGQAGTDRQVSFTSTAILKIRDGRIAEVSEELDAAGLLDQLI